MRTIVRVLAAGVVVGLLASPAVAVCTQQDSEAKVSDLIVAMEEAQARDPAKVAEIRRRFDEALGRALQPSSDPEKSTNEFCQALDALLAALKR